MLQGPIQLSTGAMLDALGDILADSIRAADLARTCLAEADGAYYVSRESAEEWTNLAREARREADQLLAYVSAELDALGADVGQRASVVMRAKGLVKAGR